MKGSVRKRDRGVWEVRVYLGRDAASGKKKYRSRSVRGSKRDADRACRDLLAEVEAARVDSARPESVSLAGWLDEWWTAKRRTLSPTTERAVNSSGLMSGVFRRVSGGRGRVPGALK